MTSEKSATLPSATETSSSTVAPTRKAGSCVVCRSRKVRCDKHSPCSNCRRANIVCVYPTLDRPPRWARRVARLNQNPALSTTTPSQDVTATVDKVMDRLRNLETLVKDLRGQLEQLPVALSSGVSGSSAITSRESFPRNRDVEPQDQLSPGTENSSLHKHFGRLVVQNANQSRYVSSGFWSRVDDELDGLTMDTEDWAGDSPDSSEAEESPGKISFIQQQQQNEIPSAGRFSALFRRNLSSSANELDSFQPLPSQVPFLVDMFSENVNVFMRNVHMPTITKMVRDLRGIRTTPLSPSNEALMFSIYYAAIVSMEDDDVINNFGSSKPELSLKFRLGLEQALSKADFLDAPDTILVQALTIFLCLARRHDSQRFVWMMTGLVVRMAYYLGLQRDGTNFDHLSPFDIEMRRRTWWAVYFLDIRASEDQGTDPIISSGSFDTKIPLNLNDVDIDPKSTQNPVEQLGVTDMSFPRIIAGIVDITRQMMALSTGSTITNLNDQSHLLQEIYQRFEKEYLQHTTDPEDIAHWVAVTTLRLVMGKLMLLFYFPFLFSPATQSLSNEIRTKLLISAIEVAEYNHELNAKEACRHWRWVFQTHTHWYSIVYLLIEISQRAWSATVERAWVALHSSWLMPAQTRLDKRLRIWVPLRKLTQRARKHRDTELERIRAHPGAAERLDMVDQNIPLPSSSGPFEPGTSASAFRERWRQLVGLNGQSAGVGPASPSVSSHYTDLSIHAVYHTPENYVKGTTEHGPQVKHTYDQLISNGLSDLAPIDVNVQPSERAREDTILTFDGFASTGGATNQPALLRPAGVPQATVPPAARGATANINTGPDCITWLNDWPDADYSLDILPDFEMSNDANIDTNMEWDGHIDWRDWIESAKGIA